MKPRQNNPVRVFICLFLSLSFICSSGFAKTYEIHPPSADNQEEFEILANRLKPGDELVLHGGIYSQNGRRAISAEGSKEMPIVIRAARDEIPLLTRPEDHIDKHNNIEFVDCAYLTIRGMIFKGGSSGIRFIRGHHVTLEDCEISHTGNNALTMNSGDCAHFIIRRNHIHHTGLYTKGPTEGEGMYIGCHRGDCITTHSLFEANYIHHTRGTSGGGNDGIEIKFGSYDNIVRNNVIHDTNLGRQFPGIFVYGSNGKGMNIVEANVIWRAGEGIQVVSDAMIRNNIIFNCSVSGITAAPHGAVPKMQNVTIVNNTLVNHPRAVRIRWTRARNMIFANNAIYCPQAIAIDASGLTDAVISANYVTGRMIGISPDDARFLPGGVSAGAFSNTAQNNFYPSSGSVLIGHADADYAPPCDFNGTVRQAPFDVGAYETDTGPANPGWKIQPAFKTRPVDKRKTKSG